MKYIVLLSWAYFFVPAAFAQVKTGTVVVAYFTQDKIVMAADSRVLVGGQCTSPDDSECKIATPAGKIIFSSTHITGYRIVGLDTVQPWTNAEEARKAYFPIFELPTGQNIGATADRWTQAVTFHLQSLYLSHPQKITDVLEDNGVLTQAYFAGIENGQLVLYWTIIKLSGGLIIPETRKITDCPLQNFCAIGKTEIVTEFAGLASQRAKQEAASWKPSKGFSASDYDLLKTIRMVDLTVAYHQGCDVHGPIDAVQLDRDGSLRWFQRKENCPAN